LPQAEHLTTSPAALPAGGVRQSGQRYAIKAENLLSDGALVARIIAVLNPGSKEFAKAGYLHRI
jgi:hypothetical protein